MRFTMAERESDFLVLREVERVLRVALLERRTPTTKRRETERLGEAFFFEADFFFETDFLAAAFFAETDFLAAAFFETERLHEVFLDSERRSERRRERRAEQLLRLGVQVLRLGVVELRRLHERRTEAKRERR